MQVKWLVLICYVKHMVGCFYCFTQGFRFRQQSLQLHCPHVAATRLFESVKKKSRDKSSCFICDRPSSTARPQSADRKVAIPPSQSISWWLSWLLGSVLSDAPAKNCNAAAWYALTKMIRYQNSSHLTKKGGLIEFVYRSAWTCDIYLSVGL